MEAETKRRELEREKQALAADAAAREREAEELSRQLEEAQRRMAEAERKKESILVESRRMEAPSKELSAEAEQYVSFLFFSKLSLFFFIFFLLHSSKIHSFLTTKKHFLFSPPSSFQSLQTVERSRSAAPSCHGPGSPHQLSQNWKTHEGGR